ncbi:unnamed protein product [Hapterophycus canaliculatus]
MGALLGVASQLRPPRIDTNSNVKRESGGGPASLSQLLLTSPFSSHDNARFTPSDTLGQPNAHAVDMDSSAAAAGEGYSSTTAESPVSQAVRETRRQGTRMQEGEQVPLSVLPYFRFLSEEAQRNVMSQLIDNFQTTSIAKRGAGTTSSASAATTSAPSPEGLAFMRSPFAKGLTPAVSAGTTTSSGNGSSSPFEVDAMMVDHHRRGASVDGSRSLGSAGACVSAAVAAVVATAPAGGHDMHRVLSAPILSPATNTEAGGSEMDQNRLPPLRQDLGNGRNPAGFARVNGSSMAKNGSSIEHAGPSPSAVPAGLSRDSSMRSPRSHARHSSESALGGIAIAAAAAAALQTEPMEDTGRRSEWNHVIRGRQRPPSR